MTIPELVARARQAADAEPVIPGARLVGPAAGHAVIDAIVRAWSRGNITDAEARADLETAIAASCYAAEHPADDRLPDTEELGARSVMGDPT